MNRQILKFKVAEQKLSTVTGSAYFASNIVRYVEARFELGANWSGFDSVRAVWWTDFDKIATVLSINGSVGTCMVPHEVLRRAQKVRVNLVASTSENNVLVDRLTSYPIVGLIIDANAKTDGDNTQPITPSQFEQFAAAVHEDAVTAEAARVESGQSAASAAESKRDAAASALSASRSAEAAAASEQNAASSERNAAQSEHNAAESEEKAEQAANRAGWAQFEIDENGHLIMYRINSPFDFSLGNDGHLYVEEVS